MLAGLSYWLSRRLPIDDTRKLELLSIHCPTQRLLRGLQILKVGGEEREGGRGEGGGREGGRKGRRGEERKGGREGGRRGREGGRKRGREGGREGGKERRGEGGRKKGRRGRGMNRNGSKLVFY